MGAGSAKGVQPEDHEDEVDSFSSASSEHWETEEEPPPAPPKPKPKPQPPPAEPQTAGPSSVVQIENVESDEKKEKPKKKTTFGFTLRRDPNTDKVDDVGNESSDDEGHKGGGERKGGDKGDKNKDKKGFRLFGWRKDEKKQEKDEVLDEDISDLEKTFDSLGIVGKNMWGGAETSAPQQHTAREDVVLSPMRKRKNVRGRGVKGVNGAAVTANGGGSSGSNNSKRTFKFSWETDKQKSPPRDEGDEWEYKAVVIEGFDIEKFRKANLKDSVFDSNSLPNVVGGDDDSGTNNVNNVSSPLRYDQTEQYILASIERDFAN